MANLKSKKAAPKVGLPKKPQYKGNYTQQIDKCEKIYVRVLQTFNQDFLARMAADDKQIQKWTKDLNVATEKQQFFTITNIKRMIDHRTREIWEVLCRKRIEDYINNGQIVKYMDKEDAEVFYAARTRYLLAMDVVDSALVDINSALHSVGLNCTLHLDDTVKKAREDIESFVEDQTSSCAPTVKEEFKEESDRINNFIEKRIEVFNRKCDRLQERYEKKLEAEESPAEYAERRLKEELTKAKEEKTA